MRGNVTVVALVFIHTHNWDFFSALDCLGMPLEMEEPESWPLLSQR